MAIEIQVNARNLDVSEKLDSYIHGKMEKLDRFFDILDSATVDLSYVETARNANDRQVAQITLRGKGVTLRAEERTNDVFASVDAATDKLLRQIDRYKGRRWGQRGDRRSAAEVAPVEDLAADAEEAEMEIVRRKRFQLLPMDEKEALEQMELLGHELFFVYLDAHSGNVNVLYRRRDGRFGLIETDVG